MKRRDLIIEAALRCFVEQGVEQTTIEMICKAASASVGSLYHHFGSKEGLAAEVYVAGLRDFHGNLRQSLRTETVLETGVRTLIYANIDWIVANPQWADFIFHYRHVVLRGDREIALRSEAKEANTMLWHRLQALEGAEQISDLSLELVYSLLVAPVHDYAKRWLEGRYEIPLIEQRELFADAAWASLVRRGG